MNKQNIQIIAMLFICLGVVYGIGQINGGYDFKTFLSSFGWMMIVSGLFNVYNNRKIKSAISFDGDTMTFQGRMKAIIRNNGYENREVVEILSLEEGNLKEMLDSLLEGDKAEENFEWRILLDEKDQEIVYYKVKPKTDRGKELIMAIGTILGE